MDEEEYRLKTAESFAKLVSLQKEANKSLDKICTCMVSKSDHERVEKKVDKILERVIEIGILLGAVAIASGVVF